jgi:predicted metal-dependent hydrolase
MEGVAWSLNGGPNQKSHVQHVLAGKDFRRAVNLFNSATFFEAHEIWEDIWREVSGPEKKFLQGLIQIAVALHHHATGNLAGARSLLERGYRNLNGCPDDFGGINLASLRQSLAGWQRALAEGTPVPPLPRL